MKKLVLVMTAAVSMGLVSCGGGAAEAGKEMCECFKDYDEIMDAASNAADTDALLEAQKKSQEMAKCAQGLKEKYEGKVDKDDVLKAMEKECPDLAKELKKMGM